MRSDERRRDKAPQETEAEDEATDPSNKQYPTGGWLRRWFWRVADGATRFGSGGGL